MDENTEVGTEVEAAGGAAEVGTVENPITTPPPVQGEAPETPETPAVEPQWPDPAEFSWDEWELSKLDALPEPVRPWATNILDKQKAYVSDLQRASDHYRSLYEALSYGKEDPRLSTLSKENQTYKEKVAQFEAAQTQFNESLEKMANEFAEREYNWFIARHGDALAVNSELEAQVVDIYSFGDSPEDGAKVRFDLEQAMKIAEKGVEAIGLAKELSKEGVPLNRIFELLDLRGQVNNGAKERKPRENPATDLVAGATPPRAPVTPQESESNLSHSDRLLRAARKAIAKTRT